MEPQVQFIGLTIEKLKDLLKEVIKDSLMELSNKDDKPLTIQDACKILNISAPTLKKYVDQGIIRRHDLGGRKKVFYRSELDVDIKKLPSR